MHKLRNIGVLLFILLLAGCCNLAKILCDDCKEPPRREYTKEMARFGSNGVGDRRSSVQFFKGEHITTITYYYHNFMIRGLDVVTSFGRVTCVGTRPDNANEHEGCTNLNTARGWHREVSSGPYKKMVFYENGVGGLGRRLTGHKIHSPYSSKPFQRVENGGNPTSFDVPQGAIIKELVIEYGADINYLGFIYNIPKL